MGFDGVASMVWMARVYKRISYSNVLLYLAEVLVYQ